MIKYDCYFSMGRRNSMVVMRFVHCTKHDSEEDFERDIQDFAERNRINYLYKEEVHE